MTGAITWDALQKNHDVKTNPNSLNFHADGPWVCVEQGGLMMAAGSLPSLPES